MSPNEAKPIITALANGIDPETGEVLSEQSVFNNPKVVSALLVASKALDNLERRKENRDKALPKNAGNAWSDIEDSELLSAFDAGCSMKALSTKHGRTEGAITSRLIKLRITDQTSALDRI